jgi:hypothetical protein
MITCRSVSRKDRASSSMNWVCCRFSGLVTKNRHQRVESGPLLARLPAAATRLRAGSRYSACERIFSYHHFTPPPRAFSIWRISELAQEVRVTLLKGGLARLCENLGRSDIPLHCPLEGSQLVLPAGLTPSGLVKVALPKHPESWAEPGLRLAQGLKVNLEVAHLLHAAYPGCCIKAHDDTRHGPGLEELVQPVGRERQVDLWQQAVELVSAWPLLAHRQAGDVEGCVRSPDLVDQLPLIGEADQDIGGVRIVNGDGYSQFGFDWEWHLFFGHRISLRLPGCPLDDCSGPNGWIAIKPGEPVWS